MKSTLSDLWRGEVHPLENKNENYQKEAELYRYVERHYNDLQKLLDEEGRLVLEKLKDCYDELLFCQSEDAFVRGFSLAVKLMTEAITD